MTAENIAGTAGFSASGGAGGRVSKAWSNASGSVSTNGGRPVSTQYSTAPRE